MNVPIARTSLTEAEIQSVLAPLSNGWLVQGPKVREFEEKWSAFTGARHSIAVTSCTTALHLSLAALGFGPGDEAIVPAFTWIATANVIEHLGGKVVFCDIDLNTFNLDVAALRSKITSRTKAILPVHLFGLAAEMDQINDVAKQHGLWVVEDAACGFGSRYHGKHVGVLGDTGCFSFHPRKAITTGEGGMITTDNDALAEKLRRLRDHGAAMTDLQRHLGARPYLLADHPDAGYNQRMTDIQAALGAAQMERADDIIAERRRLAERYDAAFADLSWLRTPAHVDGLEHGYQSYPCLFQPEPVNTDSIERINAARNAWMDSLQQAGISTRPATHAVHMLTFYREKYALKPADFPNAWAANDCSISLPLFHGMTQAEQDFVIEQVRGRQI
ncbi:DegT/DnrJ/EryC1/StrS family aminotransferase [Herbaspirillum seropedicae]|uniref:DegT/DnrJ/EryC1/StrS aminotransferase family protein n=3 Tax=Herbaspirillum seropedicae TaxID=964 RepID=D8ITN8_HERSS|nr:DegT/DnrJ/EryC1/StrS aminotransferase family protein [Herbaspirillum seropedicae SmR1]AKN67485.1 aminotransferase DegT [Herbaspirillum seropedicae]NQE32074.1 aminotransferase DegT [Herbaspirillum seropedicae]UMU24374.1 DegT/DnrJ/EryC1/StrS family aminotransferase [Herbaspirillum seropedicae]CAP19675.2 DegT/DnrJ/EryC1/StrS aminotransferase family protein [Herbaspirillum seropedicae]